MLSPLAWSCIGGGLGSTCGSKDAHQGPWPPKLLVQLCDLGSPGHSPLLGGQLGCCSSGRCKHTVASSPFCMQMSQHNIHTPDSFNHDAIHLCHCLCRAFATVQLCPRLRVLSPIYSQLRRNSSQSLAPALLELPLIHVIQGRTEAFQHVGQVLSLAHTMQATAISEQALEATRGCRRRANAQCSDQHVHQQLLWS